MVTKSRGFKMSISIGGMFLIPVRVEKAISDSSKVTLHEYHKDDMGAGGRKVYCKSCGKELATTDIVKGFEVSKGQVVAFSKEELESLPLSTTKNIEIDGFVEAGKINRTYFDATYFVSPDEASVQAYNLLVHGMKNSGKVAVGKLALRNRENLCIIYTNNSGLILSTMCWHDEAKDCPTIPKVTISDVQAELMSTIINKYSKDFVHTNYSDKYNDALRTMAEQKINGEIISVTPEESKPQNLEDALRALASA